MKVVNNSENVRTKNKGAGRAYMAYAGVASAASLPGVGVLAAMNKISRISPDDVVELSKAAQKTLKNTGLEDQGYKILKLKEAVIDLKSLKTKEGIFNYFGQLATSTETDKYVVENLVNSFKNKPLIKKLLKNPNMAFAVERNLEQKAFSFVTQVKMGINAFCCPEAKMIITPDKSLQTSIFHEMGHALNANNKVLSMFQKFRPIAQFVLPSTILLAVLSNKRKTTDSQTQNDSKMQKFKDFVKRNAGKLTFLSFTPILAEEAIASIRGCIQAKQHVKNGLLSKKIFNSINKTNALGLLSYSLSAVCMALATKTAVNVKDKIQAKHEQKIAQKIQRN